MCSSHVRGISKTNLTPCCFCPLMLVEPIQVRLAGRVDAVAEKLLLLKGAFPKANISQIVAQVPELLLVELEQLEENVRQVRNEMVLRAGLSSLLLVVVSYGSPDVSYTSLHLFRSHFLLSSLLLALHLYAGWSHLSHGSCTAAKSVLGCISHVPHMC